MPILYLPPALLAYLLFLTLLLGTVMGSFAACMASRMVTGESFLGGRSHCDHCGHTLGWRDLIPVVSWSLQKGRCRWCGKEISIRCPLTELLCGAAFVGLVLRFGLSLQTVQYMIVTVLLLAMSLVDYDTEIIPDRLLLAILGNWLIFIPFLHEGALIQNLIQGMLGGLMASVPLLLLVLLMDKVLKRESMGGGDIKLFFAGGLYFSWRGILFLIIISCILGLLFGSLINKKEEDGENPGSFPFGPAIGTGIYVSLLAAEPVMRWYLNLF